MRTTNLITRKQDTAVVEINKMNKFNPRSVKIECQKTKDILSLHSLDYKDRMSEDQRQKPKETTSIWEY